MTKSRKPLRKNEFPVHRENGFSLIEMMCTLFLLGVLAGISIPMIATIVTQLEAEQIANDLVNNLSLAQQMAISREEEVVVQFSQTGFTIRSADEVIKHWKLKRNYRLQQNYSQGELIFRSSGQSRGGTIRLIYQNETVKELKVQVASGRVTLPEKE